MENLKKKIDELPILSALKKADEEGLLYIYDDNENFHEVKKIFIDGETICIKIG